MIVVLEKRTPASLREVDLFNKPESSEKLEADKNAAVKSLVHSGDFSDSDDDIQRNLEDFSLR